MTRRWLTLLLSGALAFALAGACNDDGGPRSVSGLFSDPRETTVDRTVTLTPPRVTFAPWDGRSTMLYSINSMTEQNLGPGAAGNFSPDGTRMVWVAGDVLSAESNFSGEARMLNLGTNEIRDLGPAQLVRFKDDATVQLVRTDPPNITFEVDLASGIERVAGGPPLTGLAPPQTRTERYELSYVDDALSVVVSDVATGADVLTFSLLAHQGDARTRTVTFAGDDRLLVVTAPTEAGPADDRGYRLETVNLFLVDIPTASATFVATATGYGGVLPALANNQHIVWTDNYCTLTGTTQRSYVRGIDGGPITAIDADIFSTAFSPAGLLISGPFGGRQLIDLDEFAVRVELPGGEPVWSENGLYASIGQVGGHGGVCP